MKGQVEVWKDDNLVLSESNMLVDGAGELLADIMTVSPSLSSIQDAAASSILDASNYVIQAISFGTSKLGYLNNAHQSPEEFKTIIHKKINTNILDLGPDWPGYGALPNKYYILNIDDSGTSSYVPKVGVPEAPSPVNSVLETQSNVSSILSLSGDTPTGDQSLYDYFLFLSYYHISYYNTLFGLGLTVDVIAQIAAEATNLIGVPSLDINVSSILSNNGQFVNFGPSAVSKHVYDTEFGFIKDTLLQLEAAHNVFVVSIFYPIILNLFGEVLALFFLTNYLASTIITDYVGRYIQLQLSQIMGAYPVSSTQESTLGLVFNSSAVEVTESVYSYSPSSTLNYLSSIDMSGFINMIMSSVPGPSYSVKNPSNGLIVSANSDFSSNGIIEYSIELSPGDLNTLNQYGGIYHLGLWSIDMEKSLLSGNSPPFNFSIINNPRKYRMFCRKSLTKNLAHIVDSGSDAGILNYSPLLIKWRIHLL